MTATSTDATADELPLDARAPRRVETATFALGCFWGPDAKFGSMPGVVRTRAGYAGGTKPDPTYRDLGDHSEVVQIDYDPDRLAYEELLDVFWRSHDPRVQSPARQYRNAVLYHDDDQREAVERSREREVEKHGVVKTRIDPLDSFTLAEHYHQKYRLRQVPILVSNLASVYPDEQLVNSTVAARVNGYAAGYGTPGQLRDEIDEFDLSPAARDALFELVE